MLSIRPWPRSLASPLSSPFHPQRCELCLKPGATVGCCLSSCLSNFHFMCARASYCIFQDDKKVFCQKHTDLLDGKVGHYRGGDSSPLLPFSLPLGDPCSSSDQAPAASQCLLVLPKSFSQAPDCPVPAYRAFPCVPLTPHQCSNPFCHPTSQEIVTPDGFDVLRRVYVDFEGINFKRKFLTGLEPDAINVLIGKPLALCGALPDPALPPS